MKIALAIRHVAFEDLGLFERSIEAAGYQVRYLEAGMDDLSWLEPLDPDLLIVLGGPISANNEAEYPFIQDELEILATRLGSDLPTLGICLGAQLMARALGSNVHAGNGLEVGWGPISLTEAGQDSPLRHLAVDNNAVLHWHGDTFDLPEGAELLASTGLTRNQAFRWKKRGLALQFHPEVTVQGMERWYIGHTTDIHQMDNIGIAELREQTGRYGYGMDVHAGRFIEEWLASL
jgi:GMP synthase (glutamine-hydrolysing)